MNNKNKKTLIVLSVLLLLAVGATYIASRVFQNQLTQDTYQRSISNLEGINQIFVSETNTKVNAYYGLLRLVADVISDQIPSIHPQSQVVSLMERFVSNGDFTQMVILDRDGNGYTSDHQVLHGQQTTAAYIRAFSGQTTLLDPEYASDLKKNVFTITTPIVKHGEILGALCATLQPTALEEVFRFPYFFENEFAFILNTAGDVIVSSQAENAYGNFFENQTGVYQKSAAELDRIKQDMQGQRAGWVRCQMAAGEYFIVYQPLGINDWYLLSAFPSSVAKQFIWKIDQKIFVLFSIILLSFLILVVFILVQIGRHFHNTQKQNAVLRSLADRYQLLMEHSIRIFFEINVETGEIKYNKKCDAILGKKIHMQNFYTDSLHEGAVYPDDSEKFVAMFQKLLATRRAQSGDFRILNKKGEYIWFTVDISPVMNEKRKLDFIIGTMTNIQEQKAEMERLTIKSRTDSSTGLYNKDATRFLIEDFIDRGARDGISAMLAIDIDNFKGINDNFGHMFGDTVLEELAAAIKDLFRESDIVGRFGGDEFIVFLKNVPSEEFVMSKAKAVIEAFTRKYNYTDENYDISASVGISILEKDGNTFSQLYKKADIALYHAKLIGKGAACLYSSKGMKDITEAMFKNIKRQGDGGQAIYRDEAFISIFETLYDTPNMSVDKVLSLVGEQFDLSRVYVFETSGDSLYCSNTYEWCNQGISPQKDKMQNISYASLGDYLSRYSEEGVFFCNQPSALNESLSQIFKSRNITSVLHVALMSDDVADGFVGFEECMAGRVWTKEEVKLLTMVGKLLSVFVIKRKVE